MSLKAENKLRRFTNEDDLFDNNDNEIILAWVNELAELKLKRQSYHRRRNLQNAEFIRLAKQLLNGDEQERVAAGVDEKMEEEG